MTKAEITADNEPIAIDDLKQEVTWWPFSTWWTAKLIRDKQLACIRVGRRIWVTRTLLAEFVQAHVERAATPSRAVRTRVAKSRRPRAAARAGAM